ncbi:MAG: CPBP family glutamic-type intramembrane protease [Planctomycetota bacterium]
MNDPSALSAPDNMEREPEGTGKPSPTEEHRIPFSFAQQLEFTLKELRETLRDRRTIVTLMIMPLVLYPLLGIGLRFLAFQQVVDANPEYSLAIETESEALWLVDRFQIDIQPQADEAPVDGPPRVNIFFPEDASSFDLESTVKQSSADLGIRVKLLPEQGGQQPVDIQIIENEASERSLAISQYFQKRMADANTEWFEEWARDTQQQVSLPIASKVLSLEPDETGSAVLGLLPLILLLMTVTGGVYPAIDLTAGERERNTMETLMALPVPRFRLLSAKYIAVFTVTMLTGCMNLLALSVTLYALQLEEALLGDSGFTFALVVKLFLTLTTFALFFSSVLLLVTSSAKSFKEAQALLIPLLLISLAPGLSVFLPGWSLTYQTAVLPLVNMLLLSRELLEGSVQQLPAIVAIISTILYGVAILSMAARVFGNDAVAVGSRGNWRGLSQRPESSARVASLSTILFTLAFLFPAFVLVSGILARGEMQPVSRLVLSALMTVVLFVGVPWMLLRWQRIEITTGTELTKASPLNWIAALLLGLATWPWVFELVLFANSLGIRGFDPSKVANVDELLASWQEVPLFVIVICMGIIPGICEELFFRGFLFAGLKQHLSAVPTIAISAVAFGLFHVILAGGAAPERILPSTLMGVLLGCVAWRCRSVLPSMLLHAVHNTTLLVMVQSRDLLARWNIGQLEQEHLPWTWLAISAVVLVIGSVLLKLAPRNQTEEADSVQYEPQPN